MSPEEDDFIQLLSQNCTLHAGEVVLYCSGCRNPLLDRTMMKIRDELWHQNCLRCSVCGLKLSDRCYTKERANFCRKHFYRKYGVQCSGCGEGIIPMEAVRKVLDLVYHTQCFACICCCRQLTTGDHFFLLEDRTLVCRADYAAASLIMGNGASKRPRTTISPSQLDTLKQAYKRSVKPSRYVREQLSMETGLDMRVVQVWFQNRRAKEKRLKKDKNGAKQDLCCHRVEDYWHLV